jgi:linoleoyl-CoA desaturase
VQQAAGRAIPAFRRAPDPFATDLRERVRTYFRRTGRSPHADAGTVATSLCMVVATFGAYGLALSAWTGPWAKLVLSLAAGVGLAGIAFSTAHDALHDAYSGSRRVNRVLGWTFELLGVNAYLWRFTHNRSHHAYTNLPGLDDDISMDPLLRLSPQVPRRAFHRFQHVYAWGFYALITLYWAWWKDYRDLSARRIGPCNGLCHPTSEKARLFAFKALYLAWTVALPLFVLPLPWWQVAIGSFLMQATAGLILGMVLFPAHVEESTDHPEPGADGVLADSWWRHQMRTTTDYARGNRLLDWYLGGCNYQVEHHLFPHVCHVHYPALSRIVEATAREHGVPYHHAPTYRGVLASHVRTLKRFGRAEELRAAPSATA